jgi:hypothetical protein
MPIPHPPLSLVSVVPLNGATPSLPELQRLHNSGHVVGAPKRPMCPQCLVLSGVWI